MPIPSKSRSGQWAAKHSAPKRSVFGNYRPDALEAPTQPPGGGSPTEKATAATHAVPAAELAIARCFIYRFLAKAFEDPHPESWAWLCAAENTESLSRAWEYAAPGSALSLTLQASHFAKFQDAYVAAFGHAARGNCPLNEIEFGDIKADPLFQPHRLADLAAFYRAFGLEIAEGAGERHDHLCLQLEFMCVLAAKTAYAMEHGLPEAQFQVCLDAQKKFLKEHLGRWTPAFTRRLAAATQDPVLIQLATLTRKFIEHECARFCVTPGSDELALRPADESEARMCESCGLHQLPPGALATA